MIDVEHGSLPALEQDPLAFAAFAVEILGELRDGKATTYLTSPSPANANVFWHAGKVLALAESGLPQQFSRLLQPEEFEGGLTVPIYLIKRRETKVATTGLCGSEETERPPCLTTRTPAAAVTREAALIQAADEINGLT